MRRAIFFSIAALLLCGPSHPSAADPLAWRNIGPGGGGWVPCVAVSPHDSRVVYAGCDVGGFYKSTDGGATWRIRNEGLRDLYVECIAPHPRDPKVLYIGTEGGVYKSTDAGESWQWLREGFPPVQRYSFSAPIAALAIDPRSPDVIYAAIGRPRSGKDAAGVIYKSTDAGAHWRVANAGGSGIEPDAVLSGLAIDPQRPQRLYLASDKGVYRSDDAAATWRRLEKGLPHRHARRIALCASHPETLYVTLQSEPGRQPWQGGVYRSDDAGESWRPCLQGLATQIGKPGAPSQMTSNVDQVIVDPRNPDVAYCGDRAWVSAGVYRTLDGGKSWQKVTDSRGPGMAYGWITMWGPSVMGLALDPSAPATLYFSTSGHIFRSADRGDHWEPAYTRRAGPPNPPTLGGAAGPPGPPILGGASGNLPDVPGGLWATTGLETTCLNSIAVHPRDPRRLFFCYMDIGLLQSHDGGRSFAQTVQGMHYRGNTFTVAFDPDDPYIVWAGTGEWGANHGDVCRSEDGGFTWKVVGKPETGLPDGQTRHLVIDPASPRGARRVFVSVAGAGVYCSEDGGASWQSRSAGLPNKAIRGLAQDPKQPRTLYALLAEDGGGLFRSDDRGASWRRVGSRTWPDSKALAIAPSDPRRIYVAARQKSTPDGRSSPGGVFASGDGGVTWAQVLEDHFINALAVDPRDAGVVYAGGTDHPYHDECLGLGVMRSRDGGRTWESLNGPGLTCPNISCLTLDPHQPSRIYAGTGGNGVFVGGPR